VAFIEEPGHVCSRYRIESFRRHLSDRGGSLEVIPVGKGWLRRVRTLRKARRADGVILQRKLLPLWQLHVLRRATDRLVYDFDDALFRRDSHARKQPQSWKRALRFWAAVYAADVVLAGNAYLARRASSYVDAGRVHCVPTCVDPDEYPVAPHRRRGAETALAWIGQKRTLQALPMARPWWQALGKRLPGLELRLICDASCALPGVRTVLRRWSEATEKTELADADIGLSWLPDDGWSQGKCGLKVLQYMAAGLPVVANPVGAHVEMVIPGETGFLASTPGEWAAAISQLGDDPALRRRMGRAGRRLVERHYSVEAWGPRWTELVVGRRAFSRPGHVSDAPLSGEGPYSGAECAGEVAVAAR
jgi:glycosyltransferase involved in cell wall biosynthesis